MPKGKRNRNFYIDTNIALDYITARNRQSVNLLNKIKDKGWKCVSSSFLGMELADYKKDSIFIIEKAIDKKWEMRKILRNVYAKDLKGGDLEKIQDWFRDFWDEYKNFEMYDFLASKDDWFMAQYIAFNSNLTSPDSLHLASAILGAQIDYCQVMLTNDKFLKEEGEKILADLKPKKKLLIMTISEAEKKYFKH
jgi:hypothetical protein